MREQFPDELVVIGVHSAKFPSEQLTENIRQAVRRMGVYHPVVNDAGFRIWGRYGVRAWPTVVLIDPLGNYVGSQAGEILAADFAPLLRDILEDFGQKGELDRQPLDIKMGEAMAGAREWDVPLASGEAEGATAGEREQVGDGVLSYPAKLLLTDDGRLYVADTGHHRVLELGLSGNGLAADVLQVYGSGEAGLGDGPAAEARFNRPRGLALRMSGGAGEGRTLYVADTENHALRAIDLDAGEVRTVAGTGERGHGHDQVGTGPLEIALRSPWDLALSENTLFIAMAGSHQIWTLSLPDERELKVFAGDGREALLDGAADRAGFNQPSGLALGDDVLYVADAEASAIRAISLGAQPEVRTLVGEGLFEFGDRDGTGTAVRLQHPQGVAYVLGGRSAAAAAGGETEVTAYLYVVDTYNNKLKRLNPATRRVETVAGSGRVGSADGAFIQAQMNEPEGLAVHADAAGPASLIYIADTNNGRIRVADLLTETLHTLEIRQSRRAAGPVLPAAALGQEQRLEPVVTAPGVVTVTLDVQLPDGYKLNPDMMTSVEVEGTRDVKEFLPGRKPQVTLDAAAGGERSLLLTVYYCREDDENGLCLIHDARLVLPLDPRSGGPAGVTLRYRVEAPAQV